MGAAALLALAAAAMGTTAAPARADTPRKLTVSGEVRAQLLRAGAAHEGMPVSDFVGLAAGLTYYAYDPDTRTHWAGAPCLPRTPLRRSSPIRTREATCCSNSRLPGYGQASTTVPLTSSPAPRQFRSRSSPCGNGTPSTAAPHQLTEASRHETLGAFAAESVGKSRIAATGRLHTIASLRRESLYSYA
jgi:hypothetical protein